MQEKTWLVKEEIVESFKDWSLFYFRMQTCMGSFQRLISGLGL